MAELSTFQKKVYLAIKELIDEKPNGELTYTRVLASYLSGSPCKEIPWSMIQKSRIYGKCPSANIFSVKIACDELNRLGYLKTFSSNGNHKYLLTDLKYQSTEEKMFFESLPKHKRYLLEQFKNYIEAACPFIKGVNHSKYYGFVNIKRRSTKEYNWFWLADESSAPDSLKLFVRQTPATKAVSYTESLSHISFYRTVDTLIETLRDSKERYGLEIKRNVTRPIIHGPVRNIKRDLQSDDNCCFDMMVFFESTNEKIYLNDSKNETTDALLSISESSPYKYSGDTVFCPKQLQKNIQSQSNFGFSFLKWKIVAWSIDNDNPNYTKNALLVSKKNRSTWVLLSISKRKVLAVTNMTFEIKKDDRTLRSEELLEIVFGKK